MKGHMGSADYRAASGIMREILVNTVNIDLSEEAKKITVPTLLIWEIKMRQYLLVKLRS